MLVSQTPLPISIAGTVFADQNMNNVQDNGEVGVAGVTVTLYEFNGSQFVSTGKTATTDANGNYLFQFLLPGTYQVVETVPANYFAVGATAGTDNGTTDGVVVNTTEISQIAVLGGDNSVQNNFAIAQGVNLEWLCLSRRQQQRHSRTGRARHRRRDDRGHARLDARRQHGTRSKPSRPPTDPGRSPVWPPELTPSKK